MSVLFEVVQGDGGAYLLGFFVRPAWETRVPVAVEERSQAMPLVFSLKPVWPNPVRGEARVAFTIPVRGEVSLRVYDVAGRLVRVLWSGVMEAGRHTLTWDGTGDEGWKVGAGVYFLRLEQGGKRATRKVILVR